MNTGIRATAADDIDARTCQALDRTLDPSLDGLSTRLNLPAGEVSSVVCDRQFERTCQNIRGGCELRILTPRYDDLAPTAPARLINNSAI